MRIAAHVADRLDAPLRIESWCEALREEGRSCYHVDICDGPPVDVLLRVANREGASVMVVGRRGAGGRPEPRLGSTAHEVIERAHCPVLVVPPIGHSTSVAPNHR